MSLSKILRAKAVSKRSFMIKYLWITKGLLICLGLFAIETFVYLFYMTSPHEEHKAFSVSLFLEWTMRNFWYWAAFVATAAFSFWLARRRN